MSSRRGVEAEPFLVVAVTGRALAESAARGGRSTVVLDLFADRDTRVAARASRAVASAGALRFDRRALAAAATELAPADRSAGLVYGSGFEGRPELLEQLATGRRIFGNRPERLSAVRNPRRFFALLDRFDIPYPEVSFTVPSVSTGWLVKHPAGAGGTQVRLAGRRQPRTGAYFQRLIPGRSLSALFLADGRRACVLGFNEQWACPVRPGRPFLYGGAVAGLTLPSVLRGNILDRLDDLVAATGLIGLNGLDFLLVEDHWFVLEINPRPTATVELYDPDWPDGLFAAHLEACGHQLPNRVAPLQASRAHEIVHARTLGEIPESFEFPAWCHDIPMPGTVLRPGEPICTVRVDAASPEEAASLARARADEVTRAVAESCRTSVLQ